MDNFHECLVQKKPSGSDNAKRIGLYALALVLSVLALYFLLVIFPLNVFLAAGLFYGAYYLGGNFSVEYEYIITGDEMDIDKIIGRRKRKRLITAPIAKLDSFGLLENAPDLPAGFTTVLASTNENSGDYYCDFNHKTFGNVRIIFTPDEETISCIEDNLSPLLKAKLRRMR